MSLNGCFEHSRTTLSRPLIHWKLYKDLRQAVLDWLVEFNQSPAFWSLTFQAHLDEVRTRLGRIYDQHRDALSLRALLIALRDQWRVIGGSCEGEPDPRAPDPGELATDLEAVGKDDETVSKLVQLRNTFYAHLDAKNVAKQLKLEEKLPLPSKEIDALIDRAVCCVNRYGHLCFGHTWSIDMVGRDDYRHLLKCVRAAISADEAAIEREIAEADTRRGT